MSPLLDIAVRLGRLSLEDPRKGMRAVLDLGVPVPARTFGLLLMAVGSAVLTHIGFLLLPVSDDPLLAYLMASPFRTAVVQWLALAASVVLIARIGRARGGVGSFADALLVVVWLQLLMLAVQVVQIVALVVIPPVAAMINIAGLGLFFWLLTNFIAELHGFTALRAVFGAVVVTIVCVAFLMVIVLAFVLGPEALIQALGPEVVTHV